MYPARQIDALDLAETDLIRQPPSDRQDSNAQIRAHQGDKIIEERDLVLLFALQTHTLQFRQQGLGRSTVRATQQALIGQLTKRDPGAVRQRMAPAQQHAEALLVKPTYVKALPVVADPKTTRGVPETDE
jgi:hypothetical protein